jgi:hypothetical protein
MSRLTQISGDIADYILFVNLPYSLLISAPSCLVLFVYAAISKRNIDNEIILLCFLMVSLVSFLARSIQYSWFVICKLKYSILYADNNKNLYIDKKQIDRTQIISIYSRARTVGYQTVKFTTLKLKIDGIVKNVNVIEKRSIIPGKKTDIFSVLDWKGPHNNYKFP